MRRIGLVFVALVACKDGSKKPAAGSANAPVSTGARATDTHVRAPELPPGHAPADEEAAATAAAAADHNATAPRAAMPEKPDSIESMRGRFDSDHDGKLTPDELAKSSRFEDPSAVDTNHDGNISRDELEAAVRERRQQWRGSHRGSGSAQM